MSDIAAVVAVLALSASVLALIGALKLLTRFTTLGEIENTLRQQTWSELSQQVPQQTTTYPLNLNVINGIASGL